MSDVPENIREALSMIGYASDQIDALPSETLLVQDLGLWGDDFDDFIEILWKIYGVKKKINIKYCPGEFSWMRQSLLWLPFISQRKNLKCEPLSLGELDRMMRSDD